ncbi:MAG: hypothetical protein ISS81_07215 [Candidatus Marinimicrobia bacterium]|nr:hypothetical protein [Candidatus Neomarinimicrobiota bacterium]
MSVQLKLIRNRTNLFYIVVLFSLSFLPSMSVAQQNMQDVVYLKNGSIIRGIIIEQVPNVSIKIQTSDGNVFFYKMEDIEKITKEPRMGIVPLGKPLSKSAYLFHPLGFLQFGPILEGEFIIVPNTYFTAHFRYSALGFLYQALASEGFENEVSFGSMALGVGIRRFLESPNSPNRFYFAGFAEYGWGGTRGDVDTKWEWEGKNTQIIFASNFGYRWRFPSKFILNLGLMAGVSKGIKDDWWYINNPDYIHEDSPETYFFGMLELSLGWER